MVLRLFEETKQQLQKNEITRNVFEEKSTWLIYMIGALIGSHWASRNSIIAKEEGGSQSIPMVNAGLAKLVFQLMDETKFTETPETLEVAYLYFLDQFRKVFIGEYAKMKIANRYSPVSLASALGAADDREVLALIVTKIGFNLQHRVDMPECIEKSLDIFLELAAGVNIVHWSNKCPQLILFGRLLLEDSTGTYFLTNHCSEEFKFLQIPRYSRLRTSYYMTLAKLLFLDTRENRVTFEQFIQPMSVLVDQLWQQAGGGNSRSKLKDPSCRAPLIGLVRDLRGIALACNSVDTYMLLFKWLVTPSAQLGSARIHLFTWAADVWWEDAEVIVPLLKFMAEFVCNRGQRITFDAASASGILLFKEVSAVLLAYGTRILGKTDCRDFYKEKYKGLAVALDMFRNALSGNYVNFGVFDIYGDGALNDSLKLALRMCLAIPESDLQAYLKSLKPYYSFVELATRKFLPQVLELAPDMLAILLRALQDGICSFDSTVSMQSATAVDNIVTFLFKNRCAGDPVGEAVRAFLASQPHSLQRVLNLIFQLVTTGETTSMWTLSRPLLGLILLYEDEFLRIRQQLVDQQSEDKKAVVDGYFTELMKSVGPNLDCNSKENFTRSLYQFSSSVRSTYASMS